MFSYHVLILDLSFWWDGFRIEISTDYDEFSVEQIHNWWPLVIELWRLFKSLKLVSRIGTYTLVMLHVMFLLFFVAMK